MQRQFPILETTRLQLREIVASDAPALFKIHSDAETMQWFGVDPITELAEAVKIASLFASWFAANTGFRWGLERRDDGRLLGTCGLFRWNKSWHNCVIGFELARDCHGHGYMREAVDAIVEYGFEEMALNRIQAETHPDNVASSGLVTRIGFKFEGVHRKQAFWGNQFHDLNCYALLQEEWSQGQSKV